MTEINRKPRVRIGMYFLNKSSIGFLLSITLYWLFTSPVAAEISAQQHSSTATLSSRVIKDGIPQWNVQFMPNNMTAHMGTVAQIQVEITSELGVGI